MLSNSDIEALEDILFAEPWGDEALDFFGFHGVVCASVVGPAELSAEEIFRLATGTDQVPDTGIPEVFRRCSTQLANDMAHSLDMGQSLELPEPEDGDPRGVRDGLGQPRQLPVGLRLVGGHGRRRLGRRAARRRSGGGLQTHIADIR